MTNSVPAHLMPPDVATARQLRLHEMRLPDWGLPFGKKKSEPLPSEEEIVSKFSEKERLRIVYTSSLLMRLLHDYVLDEVVFWLKYKRMEKARKHTTLLRRLAKEIERLSDDAHPFPIRSLIDRNVIKLKRDYQIDFDRMDFATKKALMAKGVDFGNISYGINTALLMIDAIMRHGEYVGHEIARKAGVEPQDFQPSEVVTLVKALLVDLADMFHCEIAITEEQRTGIDVIEKRFIELMYGTEQQS